MKPHLVVLFVVLAKSFANTNGNHHMGMRIDADSCKEGILYSDPNKSNGYLYCSGGVFHEETCMDGTYFDASYQICRLGRAPPSSDGDNTMDTDYSDLCQRPGLTADLLNCNRYYHCSAKGVKMEHNYCPVGYIFDTSKYNCILGSC